MTTLNGIVITGRDAAWNLVEKDYFNRLNVHRAQHGFVPVEVLPALNMTAVWTAKDQATRWAAGKGLSHTDSLGRDPFQRMLACGYNQNAYKGEIIAAGYVTGEQVFIGWLNSPGHNAVMLGAEYRYVGIALAYDVNNFPIWAAEFGSVFDPTWTGQFDPDPRPDAVVSQPPQVTTPSY